MFTKLILSCIKDISYYGLKRSCLFQKTSNFSKSLYPTFNSFKEASDYLLNLKVEPVSNDPIEVTSNARKKRSKKKSLGEIKIELPVECKYLINNENSLLKSDSIDNENSLLKSDSINNENSLLKSDSISTGNSLLKSDSIKNESNSSRVKLENKAKIGKAKSVNINQESQNSLASVPKKSLKTKKTSTKAIKKLDDLIKSMNLLYDETENDRICVYTDGCCKEGKYAGIGVYWGSNCPWNVAEKFVGVQTNIRAEIAAVTRAVAIAYKQGIKKILIFTDSEFTINCMTKWVPGWKKNNWKISTKKEVKCRDVLEKLDKLIIETKIDVKWKYVRAHADDECNNCADLLAKKGADAWKIDK